MSVKRNFFGSETMKEQVLLSEKSFMKSHKNSLAFMNEAKGAIRILSNFWNSPKKNYKALTWYQSFMTWRFWRRLSFNHISIISTHFTRHAKNQDNLLAPSVEIFEFWWQELETTFDFSINTGGNSWMRIKRQNKHDEENNASWPMANVKILKR